MNLKEGVIRCESRAWTGFLRRLGCRSSTALIAPSPAPGRRSLHPLSVSLNQSACWPMACACWLSRLWILVMRPRRMVLLPLAGCTQLRWISNSGSDWLWSCRCSAMSSFRPWNSGIRYRSRMMIAWADGHVAVSNLKWLWRFGSTLPYGNLLNGMKTYKRSTISFVELSSSIYLFSSLLLLHLYSMNIHYSYSTAIYAFWTHGCFGFGYSSANYGSHSPPIPQKRWSSLQRKWD